MSKGDIAIARIESLNQEGWGVSRVKGKAVFIEGALPGEQVHFQVTRRRKSYDLARTLEILESSPQRVTPRCRYFGVCGGCSLQHLRAEAQLLAKEKVLRDNLERIGKVEPEAWLSPLSGAYWGYRRKARLGVRVVEKKGGVIVGFREKAHSFITPLASCEVLDARVSVLLPALHELIAGLSRPDRIPQIEVAAGDDAVALAFRHLVPLTADDNRRLADFGRQHGVQVFRQPGRPGALEPVWPVDATPLVYRLPEFDVELEFAPTDFIQVNAKLNRQMVGRALQLLDPQPNESVLDLFCGLGNFTLPIARHAGRVLGIEADEALIAKARYNTCRNGIGNAEFQPGDLCHAEAADPWGEEHFGKWLLDPPRTGAIEVVKRLPEQGGPQRIVYVSCNPATLARDSEVLVHAKGYQIKAAGIMDMFPQTSHAEAMALFERAD
jgi:23S rRNA (uracil1939-C5)-methyltransferase